MDGDRPCDVRTVGKSDHIVCGEGRCVYGGAQRSRLADLLRIVFHAANRESRLRVCDNFLHVVAGIALFRSLKRPRNAVCIVVDMSHLIRVGTARYIVHLQDVLGSNGRQRQTTLWIRGVIIVAGDNGRTLCHRVAHVVQRGADGFGIGYFLLRVHIQVLDRIADFGCRPSRVKREG